MVKQWLEQTYPAIEQRAKSDASGQGYAPVGKTPKIHLSTQRVCVNFIASSIKTPSHS